MENPEKLEKILSKSPMFCHVKKWFEQFCHIMQEHAA